MKSIDSAIIRCAQEIYLWLWDRTGVYVGTLVFLAYAAREAIRPHGPSFIAIGVAALWGLQLYIAQGKSLGTINALQRYWVDFQPRKYVMIFSYVFILSDLFTLNFLDALSDILFVAMNFIACVQVRDREPPEKLHFARQGAK